jgi:hypothetical protein
MMRAGLLVLLLAGCSNGGAAWETCEAESDCPSGYSCSLNGSDIGEHFCVAHCDVDEDCEIAFGAHGPNSEARCGVPIDCGAGCELRGCALTGCNDDSDCAGARCVSGNCRP